MINSYSALGTFGPVANHTQSSLLFPLLPPSLSLTLTELNDSTSIADQSIDTSLPFLFPLNFTSILASSSFTQTANHVFRSLQPPQSQSISNSNRSSSFDSMISLLTSTYSSLQSASYSPATPVMPSSSSSSSSSSFSYFLPAQQQQQPRQPSTGLDSISSVLKSSSISIAANDSATYDSYALQPWQRLAWLLIFGGMVLVAAAGNLVVIWIVLVNRQMRTVTNAFIVNLSIADIMVSTLNVIFNFVYMLNGDWLFGSTYCKVSNFIAILSVAASVFTLMAISIDR